MTTDNSKLHSEIALAIKGAKKKMLANHRDGMSLKEAANQFLLDADNRIEAVISASTKTQDSRADNDESVTATLPNGKEVELYGDAVEIAKEAPHYKFSESDRLHRLTKVEVTALCQLLARETCDDFFPSAIITLINHLYATWADNPRGEIENEFTFVANEILRTDEIACETAVRHIAYKQILEVRRIVAAAGGAQ